MFVGRLVLVERQRQVDSAARDRAHRSRVTIGNRAQPIAPRSSGLCKPSSKRSVHAFNPRSEQVSASGDGGRGTSTRRLTPATCAAGSPPLVVPAASIGWPRSTSPGAFTTGPGSGRWGHAGLALASRRADHRRRRHRPRRRQPTPPQPGVSDQLLTLWWPATGQLNGAAGPVTGPLAMVCDDCGRCGHWLACQECPWRR